MPVNSDLTWNVSSGLEQTGTYSGLITAWGYLTNSVTSQDYGSNPGKWSILGVHIGGSRTCITIDFTIRLYKLIGGLKWLKALLSDTNQSQEDQQEKP